MEAHLDDGFAQLHRQYSCHDFHSGDRCLKAISQGGYVDVCLKSMYQFHVCFCFGRYNFNAANDISSPLKYAFKASKKVSLETFSVLLVLQKNFKCV